MTTTKHLKIPVGAFLAIIIFVWTVESDLWSRLNWLSAGLLGLAIVFLFIMGDVDYHWVEDR